jgi:hypothetical protein
LKRREKGLAKAGNARVRRGLIQLAWRFLVFQKDSALTRWYRTRTRGTERRAQDDADIREMRAAAGTIGVRIRILNASSQRDLDAAFANLAQQRADALVVNNDGFLSSRRDQIVTLAAQRAVPAIYHSRDYVPMCWTAIARSVSMSDAF